MIERGLGVMVRKGGCGGRVKVDEKEGIRGGSGREDQE